MSILVTDVVHAPDIVLSDATALSSAIHRRDVSCVEVMAAYLSHIDRLNPQVNAIVARLPSEQLLELAAERDRQLAAGQSMGVLHGFPQAPKDIMPVAGLPTTRGSQIFRNNVTATDAVVYERIRACGAIFVGRTNTPEFGLGGHTYNDVYGTTGNAHDPSRSAGGSSGGAGCAVALHMLPVADGSDTMGSLRTPAAFNHVYGLRTTFGCVPNGPGDELFMQQFGVAGPMARNVDDLALLLSVQAGYDARLPLTRRSDTPEIYRASLERDFQGTRVAWLGNLGGHLAMEDGVLDTCQAAMRHFEAMGCSVEPALPRFDFEELWRAWIDLRSFSIAGSLGNLLETPSSRTLLKPEAVWEIERGLALPAMRVYQASKVRSAWYRALLDLFKRYDFLVMPAAQVFPFSADKHWPNQVGGRTMDTYHRWMEAVIGATMAGVPALSVPAGFGPSGLPAGLQILAPPQHDFEVLQVGKAYDEASGLSRVRSALLTHSPSPNV
ncbi:MAG: amidase [Variovorax paradoxus]|nr:MAG: amidase [Variovorax paradoxus]PZQ00153.1 MAG: amidase [Variovorax paradoxus]